jgi:hypothetical protein
VFEFSGVYNTRNKNLGVVDYTIIVIF